MNDSKHRFLIIASALLACGTSACLARQPRALQSQASADTTVILPAFSTRALGYVETRAHEWMQERKCISCHTAMPFVLARSTLGDASRNATAREIRDMAASRAGNWSSVPAWYDGSPSRAEQSRGSEVVINALVMVSYDSTVDHVLHPDTKAALDLMLSAQLPQGGWSWMDYQLEPWESESARFFGAALGAIAVGSAPQGYAATQADATQVKLLADFLRSAYTGNQLNFHNQLMALWASGKLPGILLPAEKQRVIDEALRRQGRDGSWQMKDLGDWDEQGRDTPGGSAYATSIATIALIEGGVPARDPRIQRAAAWLKTAFDPASGTWIAHSVNNDDEFSHGLMTDATNAYTVMALRLAGAI